MRSDIRLMINDLARQDPPVYLEVFVMTDECLDMLKAECKMPPPFYPEPHLRKWPSSLAGIPIEAYPTAEQCRDRAGELAQQKVRVCLVEEPQNKCPPKVATDSFPT